MTRLARRGNQPDRRKAALAQRLNDMMREQGITVAEATRRIRAKLPEGTKFNAAHFCNYKNGRTFPRATYLEAISLAFGLPPSVLLLANPPQKNAVTDPEPSPDQAKASEPPVGALPLAINDGFLSIEDHGGNVRIRLDKRIDWTQALTILKVLKEIDSSPAEP